jgi:hypothetical protein
MTNGAAGREKEECEDFGLRHCVNEHEQNVQSVMAVLARGNFTTQQNVAVCYCKAGEVFLFADICRSTDDHFILAQDFGMHSGYTFLDKVKRVISKDYIGRILLVTDNRLKYFSDLLCLS